MPITQLQRMVYASLLAALMAVGAYIHIPIGPVPIVLQNMFVLLAGLLLGSRWGLASVCIYLLVGAMGMPVFAGGKGGIVHFVGPTGGYLLGYVVSVLMVGYISERSDGPSYRDIVAVVVGALVTYMIGVPWLKAVTGMTWTKAFAVGMAPFVFGDGIKAAAAIAITRAVRPMVKRQLETAPL